MKIECILQLMQEKGYIDISEYSEGEMPLIHTIRNHRGKEFGSKLFHAIFESEDYLADFKNSNFPEISIARKADIDEWLEALTKETTRIRWISGRLDQKVFKYIEKKDFEVSLGYSHLEITNLKLKNERLKRINEENQKAIDLLDQLL